jgi:uncharacterized protein (TIGR02246 family)
VNPRHGMIDLWALNAKDPDELGGLFIDDAEFVNIMGMRMRRREGIVEGHGWAFAGPLRGRRVHFDQVDELSVTNDVTVLIGHCVREREPDAPVAGLPDGASVLVFVTRRMSPARCLQRAKSHPRERLLPVWHQV